MLMGNHYHLVLRTLRPNLSRAMHWLGASYVNWFNARHGRSGHLFQGRFKGFVVEDEDYLRRLLLYVHRNPLRAGLVERLADYRWSSYGCLAYRRRCPKWLARKSVLGRFGDDERTFRTEVQRYSEEEGGLLEDLRHGLFLGSKEGLARFLARTFRGDRHREKPQSRGAHRACTADSVEALAGELASALGLSARELEALRRPKRGVRRPMREVLIYLVWQRGDFRLADIGAYFGVGYTSIVNARQRGTDYAKRDRRIRRKVRGLNR